MRDALNSLLASGSLDLQGLSEHSSRERMETVPFLRTFRPLELILLEADCGQVSISDSVSSVFRFSPFRKESAYVNVIVTLFSISSNHAKIMQVNANALLVGFTKFDKTICCAQT
jgi:hypothetical protein